jgi:hypothetical protein
MSTNWHNNDGLYVKFGELEAVPSVAGEHSYDGLTHELEFEIADFTTLTDANAIIDSNIKLPDGALISKITLIVTEAATSGGSAVLDIGVIDEDRASNGDDDALVAAEAVADMGTIGNTIEYVQGATGHGVLVGTILTKSVYITVGYDTAAFTAGAAKVLIEYFMTE